MAQWDKQFDPSIVVDKLEEVRSHDGKGKVQFEAWTHSESMVLLSTMVSVSSEIPDRIKRRLISDATFQVGKRNALTPERILSAIGRLEGDYLSKTKTRYRLITEISLARTQSLKRRSFDGSVLTTKPVHARTVQWARAKVLPSANNAIHAKAPSQYSGVSVTVQARAIEEAFEKAIGRLDVIRAIWNLALNRRHGWRMSMGPRKPVNALILAPIHTLHTPDGRLATEAWWYEPLYQGPVRTLNNARDIEALERYTDRVKDRIKKLGYAAEINDALVRYVRALDVRNWEDAFLRLWSVLETLTATTSQKATVRRASFLFHDREYAQELVSHLKEYRNRAVHAGGETADIEALMFQLKRLIETLLEFHIAAGSTFKSLQDAGELMELPHNRDALEQRRRRIEYVKRFVSR